MAKQKPIQNEKDEVLEQLFALCPFNLTSEFERDNFDGQAGVARARYIVSVINRIRKINSDLELEQRTFEKNCLLEEREYLVKFIKNEPQNEIQSILTNWQITEEEYWIDYLGKVAAIELLTFGKPSMETMTKMVKLPESAYIKATQICVKLANAIKEATVMAEQEIGVDSNMPADPAADEESIPPSQPKRLKLKKVK
jgi:hypothetical protein